jgi:hypothetical protein
MSAEKRIRELKERITTYYETKIIEDPDEIVKACMKNALYSLL